MSIFTSNIDKDIECVPEVEDARCIDSHFVSIPGIVSQEDNVAQLDLEWGSYHWKPRCTIPQPIKYSVNDKVKGPGYGGTILVPKNTTHTNHALVFVAEERDIAKHAGCYNRIAVQHYKYFWVFMVGPSGQRYIYMYDIQNGPPCPSLLRLLEKAKNSSTYVRYDNVEQYCTNGHI